MDSTSYRICAFFNVKKINPLRLFQTQNYSLQTRRKSPKNYKTYHLNFRTQQLGVLLHWPLPLLYRFNQNLIPMFTPILKTFNRLEAFALPVYNRNTNHLSWPVTPSVSPPPRCYLQTRITHTVPFILLSNILLLKTGGLSLYLTSSIIISDFNIQIYYQYISLTLQSCDFISSNLQLYSIQSPTHTVTLSLYFSPYHKIRVSINLVTDLNKGTLYSNSCFQLEIPSKF